MVEHQLPKLRVASSILVTRSSKIKASEDSLNPSEAFFGCGISWVILNKTVFSKPHKHTLGTCGSPSPATKTV